MLRIIFEGVVFAAALATIFLLFFLIAAGNDSMWGSLFR
jgi:hypothetical protein